MITCSFGVTETEEMSHNIENSSARSTQLIVDGKDIEIREKKILVNYPKLKRTNKTLSNDNRNLSYK